MKCVVGIDLGSTTTKAVLLDEEGNMLGRGITNSRSNYEVASSVARDEAFTAARFTMLERELRALPELSSLQQDRLIQRIHDLFRLEVYRSELSALQSEISTLLDGERYGRYRSETEEPALEILGECVAAAPSLFAVGASRKSDFFRDLAGAAFMSGAEKRARSGKVPFERLIALFDKAVFNVETMLQDLTFAALLAKAIKGTFAPEEGLEIAPALQSKIAALVKEVGEMPLDEMAYVGTGYGRRTLPFPKEAIRSEILCHGRGAHRVFPGTRSVLDIGGQDTKALQVNDQGVVTSFQMNDRCAAGCGRYLGYIADELNLGLHELGPLALKSEKLVKINSTCTVFAGAELRERLSLGQAREDILAALHRAIVIRAMSLVARSGGVTSEFTFTGGVCKNPMATKVLRELVISNYSEDVVVNTHPDSIYMGALGAAMFALDDARMGRGVMMGKQESDNAEAPATA